MSDKYIKDSLEKLSDDVKNVDKTLTEYKVSFDHHILQDEKMYEEFKRMNDVLVQNTESLKEHMHRTALLEETIIKIDQRLSPIEKEKIEKEAVKAWMKNTAVIVGKAAAVVGAIGSAVAFLVKFLHHI